MKKTLKSGVIIFSILIIVIVIASVFTIFIKPSQKEFPSFPSITFNNGNKSEYIGHIEISGVIQESNKEYNQKWLLTTIENLKKDNKNKALAIYINSPGGNVYHADQIYLALQNYKTTGRPIYVYQGPLAASGGYYISLAGNKIYANRNTLTGSIGVISGNFYDLTALYEKLGIRSKTIHSGKNKNMGNFNEPYTQEQIDIMQSISDECYRQFCSIVVSQRNLSFEQVYKLADGRIYTANQALENGLIDRVDSWENMISSLSSVELNNPKIKVKTYKYQKKTTFMEQLLEGITNIMERQAAYNLGLPINILKDMDQQQLYPAYLYNQE